MAPNSPTGRSLVRSLLDSNPFYLISACCMLAGCLALTNSLSWVSIPTSKLLILIWTLNLYEAALIGLAAYLVLARGLRRDGMILIILEVFFLIDITFLVSEIATRKSWLGPAIAGVVFIAAIIKLAAVMRILNIRRAPAEFLFILIQLAAILAIPILFSRYDGGSVPPRVPREPDHLQQIGRRLSPPARFLYRMVGRRPDARRIRTPHKIFPFPR